MIITAFFGLALGMVVGSAFPRVAYARSPMVCTFMVSLATLCGALIGYSIEMSRV